MTTMLFRVSRLATSRSRSGNYSRLLSAYKTTKYSTSTALGSSLSSFFEPDPTLFSPMEASGKDAQLRSDIRTMGSLLGKIIQEQNGVQVFNQVEALRHLAKNWRELGAGRGSDAEKQEAAKAFQELTSYASSLTNSELFWVSRAFTHFLAIANAAEGHHRGRSLVNEEPTYIDDIHALSHKHDSCGGLIPQLLLQQHSKEDIYQCIITQQTELVLTAHPTEVNRRTILDKQRRVQLILTQADALRGQTTPYQQIQLNQALEREIAALWQSDEVARSKPSPQEEAERGTLVVETVLWDAVPVFLRKLNATMMAHLGSDRGLPLDAAPIKFASWMGGDRDGNPNVTQQVTREVCLTKRVKAATLFQRDLIRLQGELSITKCSDELWARVDPAAREPYRDFLSPMIRRLALTVKWGQEGLSQLKIGHSTTSPTKEVYLNKKDIMADLLLVHKSLCETGNEITANGLLKDIIRNVSAFGLTLVPLDIRQESDRHAEAIDSITRYLGLGSYDQWDESTKINWLIQQLASDRPLLRAGCWKEHPTLFSDTAVDTLDTFQMIAEQYEESLGAYVISQATSASDVLAVLLLQRDAGVQKPLRVVPLFETLEDLKGAAATMETLFSLPGYMGSISGKQEVMIGYSDSAKDAGRLAASWAQYETQEQLATVAKKYNVELTFFHGKGGTVARGGNPATFKAILAHAPDTINGRFRVTEQGEMITRNFGHADRAERTLDIYTAALLAEKLTPRPSPTPQWREMMGTLSDISCAAYRRIVREDARFVPYFRSATPELELANLNIGSRPSKRKPGGGVESLRAIPWIFAWTQTRLNLPVWLGVGEALSEVLAGKEGSKLRDMYRDFGSFKTTIDLVEMVLAKSEPSIAKHYDKLLVSDPKAQELGEEVRTMHMATERAVLDLTEHETLTDANHLLRRALLVRNPYVDCLNVLQAETLKRIRAEGGEEGELKDALMTTITGIANGMGNTG